MSKVKDMSLAPEGVRKIEWVQKHMPVLEHIKEEYLETQPFKGITIGSCLHLEPKTINLGLTLMAGGAEVAMTGCNPLSTHDDAVAGAADLGLNVYGWREQDDEEYYQTINMVLDHKPDIIIDDGADMIMVLHNERKELLSHIKGACEETTTGVHRLQAMHTDGALKFPVIAVNDAYTKYLFDNRYGTGQSSFDAIMGTTNMVIAGKTVVVCGYGWCGRGLALRAAGLGADVIVTEVDPIRALEARMACALAPSVPAVSCRYWFPIFTVNLNSFARIVALLSSTVTAFVTVKLPLSCVYALLSVVLAVPLFSTSTFPPPLATRL